MTAFVRHRTVGTAVTDGPLIDSRAARGDGTSSGGLPLGPPMLRRILMTEPTDTPSHDERDHVQPADGRNDEPGGMAASGEQSEGGGKSSQKDGFHSGYAPTDTGGHEAGQVDRGHPQGMNADGSHSQGGGSADTSGRSHSGWGPVDGENAEHSQQESRDD